MTSMKTMNTTKVQEKVIMPKSGYLFLAIEFALIALSVFLFISSVSIQEGGFPLLAFAGGIIALVALIMTGGFFINQPNQSKVLILFGTYIGTVKQFGFHWANPFYSKKHVSLRALNLNGQKVKVNDALGNPIEIAAVVVWQVEETAHAVFEVDDFAHFVEIQSEAAVRTLAGKFPYDNFEHDVDELTLRGGAEAVNHILEQELTDRLNFAGIRVIEARISHLAYASEIAGAMLQRQQATAVVAARFKIVEGAVGMVEMALEELSKKNLVNLDEDKKAAMVSNLLVVLCGDKSASPVVNTGTLHQ